VPSLAVFGSARCCTHRVEACRTFHPGAMVVGSHVDCYRLRPGGGLWGVHMLSCAAGVLLVASGVGITRDGLATLFREYVQGTEDEMCKPRTRGGTGLGLSICSKQVSHTSICDAQSPCMSVFLNFSIFPSCLGCCGGPPCYVPLCVCMAGMSAEACHGLT
jgi:hypothetical protein